MFFPIYFCRHVYHTAGMKRALRALIRADKDLKEAGKVVNKNESDDGMFLQEDNTSDEKEMKSYNKAKKQYNKILREFKIKFSIYTYHVMMAVHALKNPFTSDVNTQDYTDDDLFQQDDLAPAGKSVSHLWESIQNQCNIFQIISQAINVKPFC